VSFVFFVRRFTCVSSPDGKNIAFGYKGDIYVVNANGTCYSHHEGHDMMHMEQRWKANCFC
jgi:hypothetical protein